MMPNRTENVLDLLRNQCLCRSVISIMLLVLVFKINHHHQLLAPDYNGTGLFSYARPIRTSASFAADFVLLLCCIQSLTRIFRHILAVYSVKAKELHSFPPSVYCHTVGCVDTLDSKRSNTVDVEIVVVKEEHLFVRNLCDSLQALKMIPFVTFSDFYVVKAGGKSRTILDQEPLHTLSRKGRLVTTRCHGRLYGTMAPILFPLVDFAEGVRGPVKYRDGRSQSIRHNHTLSIRGLLFW